MDHEKEYKEALEGVKKIHSGIKEVLAELGDSNLPLANILNEAVWALNKQFPELTESEDERIRKELKEAFEAYDIESTWNGIPIRSIFAWLEKQKEQKPTKKDHITPDEEFFQWIYDRLVFVHKENPNVDYMCSLKERIEEMRKEQKPAEWSEEDKQVVDGIIGSLCDFKNLIIESDSHWVSNPKLKDISREIVWLKSLRPSWKPGEEQMEA